MKKNGNGFANSKERSTKNDEYTNMILYGIVEKIKIFNEVLYPEYKNWAKLNKKTVRNLDRLMKKIEKKLVFCLRRVGVLVIEKGPFAGLQNKLCPLLPYNKKSMFKKIALNLYKFSKFEEAFKKAFCNDEDSFVFDWTRFEKYEIKVQVAEIDCSLIASGKFELLQEQLETSFKKIRNKKDLSIYLGQFFNLNEDINDCFRIAGKKAC